MNERTENIGARRLSTVMERLLDEVSFDAARLAGQTVRIDAAYVDARLQVAEPGRRLVALHPVTKWSPVTSPLYACTKGIASDKT